MLTFITRQWYHRVKNYCYPDPCILIELIHQTEAMLTAFNMNSASINTPPTTSSSADHRPSFKKCEKRQFSFTWSHLVCSANINNIYNSDDVQNTTGPYVKGKDVECFLLSRGKLNSSQNINNRLKLCAIVDELNSDAFAFSNEMIASGKIRDRHPTFTTEHRAKSLKAQKAKDNAQLGL
ncbi:RNA-directed RNA polymerase lambda-3 [Trichinella pseudospiralis]